MTADSAKYRLSRNTTDGFVKRYITVDDRGGEYLLLDAHITLIAPTLGLVEGHEEGSVGIPGRDTAGRFADLESANAAAKTLYDQYINEGWEDASVS